MAKATNEPGQQSQPAAQQVAAAQQPQATNQAASQPANAMQPAAKSQPQQPQQPPTAAQQLPAKQQPPAPAANPSAHRSGPLPEQLAEFCAAAVRIGPYLSMEQRKAVIVAVGDPKPLAKEEAKPSPYEAGKTYRFRVSWGDEVGVVEADSELSAWAMFCDSIKRWPSPKARKVECLGEVEQQAAA